MTNSIFSMRFQAGILSLFLFTSVFAQKPVQVQNFMQNKSLSFIENRGQLKNEQGKLSTDILYYGKDNGVNLYCKNDMISFVFTKTEGSVASTFPKEKLSPAGGGRGWKKEAPNHISSARLEMQFINANLSAAVMASGQQEYYENYYTTGDANHGITNVRTYTTITYQNIYPHIDLILKAGKKSMEYSFLVHPGGNVGDIQIEWKGADSIKDLENGGISYQVSGAGFGVLGASLRETAPICYLVTSPKPSPKERASGFASGSISCTERTPLSLGEGQGVRSVRNATRISFSVPSYDKTKDLLIDPTLDWGTYFGGSGDEDGTAVTHDANNNIYVTGWTRSQNGIATSGVYQTSLNGRGNAFIAKFTASGSLLWATYYGGNFWESANGISVDSKNNIYITGNTGSTSGIATSGAYQTYNGGGWDAFLAKFTSSGNLDWGTYYGGDSLDWGYGVTNDSNDNVYITGYTGSENGIATVGAYLTTLQDTSNSGSNVYVAKFTSSGNLNWGTYYGGKGGDVGIAIAADHNNNIYITGSTASDSGIATSGAYQTSYGGGLAVFIAKFTFSGSLTWATYYGGNGGETGNGITTDINNNIYIVGNTNSSNGIATHGAYETKYNGGGDVFIAKFTLSGSLDWATYYGGSGEDDGNWIALDTSNDIYITGYSDSKFGIATPGAYQLNSGTVFISKFASSGNLIWGSYYGGNSGEPGNGVTVDKYNNAYITGWTESTSGIATSGAYQTAFGGGSGYGDAFLAEFSFPCFFSPVIYKTTDTLCPNTITTYTAQKDSNNAYAWRVVGGTIMSGKNSDTVSVKWGSAGTDTLWMIETSKAGCTDSVMQVITVNAPPVAKAGNDTCIFKGDSAKIDMPVVPHCVYFWSSYPYGYISAKAGNTVKPLITTTYYLTVTDTLTHCSGGSQVTVSVTAGPINAHFTVDTLSNNSFLFNADDILESAYNWTFGDGSTGQGYSASHGYHKDSTYLVTLTVTNYGGCSTTYDSDFVVKITEGIHMLSAEQLHLNIFPNPFSEVTDIQYSLPNPVNVQISVYDMNGLVVANLTNTYEASGNHTVPFEAAKYNCSPGIYLVKMIIDNIVVVRQVVRIE